MKAFVFSCNAHPTTKAVSVYVEGSNLPGTPCANGQWIASGHIDLTGVERDIVVPGVDMKALRADLETQGWHLFTGADDDSAFNISYV